MRQSMLHAIIVTILGTYIVSHKLIRIQSFNLIMSIKNSLHENIYRWLYVCMCVGRLTGEKREQKKVLEKLHIQECVHVVAGL